MGGGLRRKNLRNFTIFSKNTLVPISPTIFEIYIKNYFVGVMNDVILMIEFLKFTLYNFNSIAFSEVLNSMHFDDLLHSNLL